MLEYQYAYLVWCGVFAAVWVVLYMLRPESRRDMLVLSFIMMPFGPLSQYFHLRDYWVPQTITGTPVGPEDFVIAFLIGGISAALYGFFVPHDRVRVSRWYAWPAVAGIYAVTAAFFAYGIGSYLSGEIVAALFISFGVAAVAIRPRFLLGSVGTSLLFGLLLFGFYLWFFNFYPGIRDAWWPVERLLGVYLWGVPLEEVLWGLLWGFVAGPATELAMRAGVPQRLVKVTMTG